MRQENCYRFKWQEKKKKDEEEQQIWIAELKVSEFRHQRCEHNLLLAVSNAKSWIPYQKSRYLNKDFVAGEERRKKEEEEVWIAELKVSELIHQRCENNIALVMSSAKSWISYQSRDS